MTSYVQSKTLPVLKRYINKESYQVIELLLNHGLFHMRKHQNLRSNFYTFPLFSTFPIAFDKSKLYNNNKKTPARAFAHAYDCAGSDCDKLASIKAAPSGKTKEQPLFFLSALQARPHYVALKFRSISISLCIFSFYTLVSNI